MYLYPRYRLKSSLFAAGTAISESLATSTFDGTVVAPSQGSQQQGYYGNNRAGPGAGGGAMYGQQQQQQQRYPPAGTGAGTGGGAAAGNSGSYGYDSRGRPIQQHMRAADEGTYASPVFLLYCRAPHNY